MTERPNWYPDFLESALFDADAPARASYQRVRSLILREDCDLSTYRFLLNWEPHVVVLGAQPGDLLARRIRDALAGGRSTTLDLTTIRTLADRRASASRQGSWVERSWHPPSL